MKLSGRGIRHVEFGQSPQPRIRRLEHRKIGEHHLHPCVPHVEPTCGPVQRSQRRLEPHRVVHAHQVARVQVAAFRSNQAVRVQEEVRVVLGASHLEMRNRLVAPLLESTCSYITKVRVIVERAMGTCAYGNITERVVPTSAAAAGVDSDNKQTRTPTVFLAGSLHRPRVRNESYDRGLTAEQKAYRESSGITVRRESVEIAKRRRDRTKNRYEGGEHQLKGLLRCDESLVKEAEGRLAEYIASIQASKSSGSSPEHVVSTSNEYKRTPAQQYRADKRQEAWRKEVWERAKAQHRKTKIQYDNGDRDIY
jgi:hypothetical protein